MDELYTRFDATFFEKTRLSLVTVLYQEEEASFSQLKRRMSLTDGALHSHMERLIAAGYATKDRRIAGVQPQTVFRLSPDGRGAFREYLAFIERMLSDADRVQNPECEEGRITE